MVVLYARRRRWAADYVAAGSRRLDEAAHDPCVLAHLADPGEVEVLEKPGCRAEQEAALRLASGGHLGDRLDKPAAKVCDLVQRAFQRRPGDAPAAVLLIDVDAGNPPVWTWRGVLVIFAPVLDARKFSGAAVLAPALRQAIFIEDERGMGAARPDAVFFGCAMVGPPSLLLGLQVKADTPAAAENAVVAIDKLSE